MNVAAYVAVWDFGDGVKYQHAFPTAEARQDAMEHVLEGREEGLYTVTCSDRKRRRLRAAIACYTVATIRRKGAEAQ